MNSVSSHTKRGQAPNVAGVELERLDLSVRTSNCMRQANITTIGELARLTKDEILKIQNAGQKTLNEIRGVLASLGLTLEGDEPSLGQINPRLIGELQLPLPMPPGPAVNAIDLESAKDDVLRRLCFRLSFANTSVRAKGVFTLRKLTYIGDLVQLSFADLMKIDNLGRQTASELAGLVKEHGLELGTPIVGWSREAAEQLEKTFAIEHARDRIENSNALLATLGPQPTLLAEELSRIVAALASGRNHSILIALWGWNGSEPQTLEAVGEAQTPPLTRERVRQIEARALRQLRAFKFDTPLLRSAMLLIRKCVPALAASCDSELRRSGLCEHTFSLSSIRRAANILGLHWSFAEVRISGLRVLVHKEDEDRIARIMHVVRRRTSELGCLNLLSLVSALNLEENKSDILRQILDVTDGISWLDDERTWLFLKGAPRNRLFNLCAKVLSVCPRIRIAELRRAVGRSRRLSIVPPQKVLARFVEAIDLGKVENNVVTAELMNSTSLSAQSVEGKIIEVFEKYGTVLHGEDFAERCIEHGVNPTTFYVYRMNSPVIASLGRNIYCKVGAEVRPGTVEDIVSRHKSTLRSSDHGWLPNGNLWFGFEMTRIVLTAGSVRLKPFVSNLVQGEWNVRLADGQLSGSVICREVFIWSFRRAFATISVEPEDFVAFEFEKNSREIHLRVGGPDLFETIQEGQTSEAILGEEF